MFILLSLLFFMHNMLFFLRIYIQDSPAVWFCLTYVAIQDKKRTHLTKFMLTSCHKYSKTMKNKNYHTVGTIPNSITNKHRILDTPNKCFSFLICCPLYFQSFIQLRWHGFAPGLLNFKKGWTRFAAASDKVYQLLAHDRWFSPGTPDSFTTKTGRHDIAGILLKVALNTINQIKSNYSFSLPVWYHQTFLTFSVY